MKRETTAQKLAALLGIEEKVDTSVYSDKPKKRKASLGISEDEIQKRREAQGLLYFLQAPELFKYNTCKNCEEPFLVSRPQVAYCSYTCIEHALLKIGIKWNQKGEYERLTKEAYEGNEPIWIRRIDFIKELIESVPVEPSTTDHEHDQTKHPELSSLGV